MPRHVYSYLNSLAGQPLGRKEGENLVMKEVKETARKNHVPDVLSSRVKGSRRTVGVLRYVDKNGRCPSLQPGLLPFSPPMSSKSETPPFRQVLEILQRQMAGLEANAPRSACLSQNFILLRAF